MTTAEVGERDSIRIPPLAQRLFREFGNPPASDVFAAIGCARRVLGDRGARPPDPQLVEDVARNLLRARLRAEAPRRWSA